MFEWVCFEDQAVGAMADDLVEDVWIGWILVLDAEFVFWLHLK